MYRINLFRNLKSPENPKTISIGDYVEYVRNGINPEQVLTARFYAKGSPLYQRYKEQRPCVTHNFIFDSYKKDTNIVSSTGLLYYDIDQPIDANILDQSKTFIHHKSFGGVGESIIIKAEGITPENFKDNYIAISTELGIKNYIDINAVKKSQYTVLSYDPHLFFNQDSYVFTATEKLSFRGNMYPTPNLPTNDSFLNNYKYRLTNASEYVDKNKLYEVFAEGISVAKIHIPRNVPVGNRTVVLMAIANQLLSLNTFLTFDHTLEKLLAINNIITNEPLPYKEVWGIAKSIYKYKEEGTLKPIPNKIRKVIFNEDCDLTREEKVTIVNQEVGKMRVDKTKQHIHDAVVQWNKKEKITAKKIAKEIGKGIATVNRYWPEFKILVNEFNVTI